MLSTLLVVYDGLESHFVTNECTLVILLKTFLVISISFLSSYKIYTMLCASIYFSKNATNFSSNIPS
jgi:hypothetical protein